MRRRADADFDEREQPEEARGEEEDPDDFTQQYELKRWQTTNLGKKLHAIFQWTQMTESGLFFLNTQFLFFLLIVGKFELLTLSCFYFLIILLSSIVYVHHFPVKKQNNPFSGLNSSGKVSLNSEVNPFVHYFKGREFIFTEDTFQPYLEALIEALNWMASLFRSVYYCTDMTRTKKFLGGLVVLTIISFRMSTTVFVYIVINLCFSWKIIKQLRNTTTFAQQLFDYFIFVIDYITTTVPTSTPTTPSSTTTPTATPSSTSSSGSLRSASVGDMIESSIPSLSSLTAPSSSSLLPFPSPLENHQEKFSPVMTDIMNRPRALARPLEIPSATPSSTTPSPSPPSLTPTPSPRNNSKIPPTTSAPPAAAKSKLVSRALSPSVRRNRSGSGDQQAQAQAQAQQTQQAQQGSEPLLKAPEVKRGRRSTESKVGSRGAGGGGSLGATSGNDIGEMVILHESADDGSTRKSFPELELLKKTT